MRGRANHLRWLLCVLFLTWPVQAKYGGGNGTGENPYFIDIAEQMNAIGAEPNDWDKHFKLVVDIDLKDFGGSSFNLIGSDSHPFKGVFDGNGHTISNLTYVVTGNEELTYDNRIMPFGLFRLIDDPNAVWIDGDYHLKSQTVRWDSISQNLVQDDMTSPCIDAGDLNSPIGDEPIPNGGRINIGAYGGTEQASKSY